MDVVRRTGFKSNIERGMKKRFVTNEISDLSSDSDTEHGPTTDGFNSQGCGELFICVFTLFSVLN